MEEITLPSPQLEFVTFDSTAVNCATRCAHFTIKSFYFKPKEFNKINDAWSQVLFEKPFNNKEKFVDNFRDMLQLFQNENDEFKKEAPQSPAFYEWFETDSLVFADANYVSILRDQYFYWGGAHGQSLMKYINIDKSGKLLEIQDFYQNTDSLKIAAEKSFRSQYSIPETGSINQTGKMFEHDQFFLPESFSVTKDSVIFVFQPYEVAAYAAGIHRFGLKR